MATVIGLFTGGTTGARDGTLVRSTAAGIGGSAYAFAAANTDYTLHYRVIDSSTGDDPGIDSVTTVPFTVPDGASISSNGSSWTAGPATVSLPAANGGNKVVHLKQTALVPYADAVLTVGAWDHTSGSRCGQVGTVTPTKGNALVALAWSAPTGSPTGYEYRRSSDGGSTWGSWTDTGSSSTGVTVTGLTNGTAYVFEVRGYTTAGAGQASAVSASATPSTSSDYTFYADGTHGRVSRVDVSSDSFAGARAASAGSTANNDLASGNWLPLVNLNTGLYYLYRGFLFFDTSAIPDGATITAAKLRVRYGSTVSGSPSVGVVASNVASDSACSTSDFTAFGSTEFATRQSPATNTWVEWTLNSSGLAAINKSGTTKLCLRDSQDLDNAYTGPKYGNIRSQDDGTYCPQLVVTYS